MASDYGSIRSAMVDYSTKWNGLFPNKSQMKLFSEAVPEDDRDFTEVFRSTGLSSLFTGERLRSVQGFNCNALYRSVQDIPDIIVFDNGSCVIICPMGEPGRDKIKNKAGHLMAVPYKDQDFNLMLPSTMEEVDSSRERVVSIKDTVKHLQNNLPVKECGPKVVEKATSMEFDLDKGIMDFVVHQIVSMTDDRFNGRPGYNLVDNSGNKVERTESAVREAFTTAFSSDLEAKVFIQDPTKNTQLLSHYHCFTVEEGSVPEVVNLNYKDVDVILGVKEEFIQDVPLIRTRTPPPPISDTVDEGNVLLMRCASSRNYAHRDD